jgi:aerobic carbon-monoxide dehydrogenase medium subunit
VKFAPFEYHRPSTVSEAVEMLAEHGHEAKVLAGGQSLLPVMALRLAHPAHLIDIGGVGGIGGIDGDGELISIGAGVRHSTVESSSLIAGRLPVLGAALSHAGHVAIRNRGTVGGSLAHADPAAELPAVALAFDAELLAVSVRGERIIPVGDFFVSYLTTALEHDELLTEVRFRVPAGQFSWAVEEVSRRHGDFALGGVVAVAGYGVSTRLAFLGIDSTPVRASQAEAILDGGWSDSTINEAVNAVRGELTPHADNHASADYRRYIAAELAARCLDRVAPKTFDSG